jgi:hypothetical protein
MLDPEYAEKASGGRPIVCDAPQDLSFGITQPREIEATEYSVRGHLSRRRRKTRRQLPRHSEGTEESLLVIIRTDNLKRSTELIWESDSLRPIP